MKRMVFGLILLIFTASPLFSTDRYALTSGGTGAGTCTTIGTPCTVARLLTQLVAGDTGYFCATDCDGADSATYTGAWFNDNIPPGTSFSNAVTLKPYTGETITLQPASGEQVFNFRGNDTKYIVIYGFVLDCVNVDLDCVKIADTGGTYAEHIRIQNNEIKNAKNNGILSSGPSPATASGCCNEILSNNIHDNATVDFMPFAHGIYITSQSNVIDGNTCHDHNSDTAHNSLCVHIYNGGSGGLNNNIVRNNVIYNNTRGGCILAGNGSNIQIYNNICNANYSGITVFSGTTAELVYSNTVYGSTLAGISLQAGATNAVVKNNIAYLNGTNYTDSGSGTTHTNNLEGTNPQFTSASTADFTLTSASPAVGDGTTYATLGAPYNGDILGASRPVGAGYDAGAYEFNDTVVEPACAFTQCETFDNYPLSSDLSGLNSGNGWTGPWTYYSGSAMTIASAPSGGQGGMAAESTVTTESIYYRNFTAMSAGSIRFLVRFAGATPLNAPFYVRLLSGTTDIVNFSVDTNCNVYNSTTAATDSLGACAQNTWYTIDIEVDNANQPNLFRARLNLGAWTAWKGASANFTTIDRFQMLDEATNAHTFWVDGIGGSPAAPASTPFSMFNATRIR